MKKAIWFKTLVDILYILHCIGLVAILLLIPFGELKINKVKLNVEDFNLFYWLALIIGIITYIIFLRGLYFLRETARFLLSNKKFSDPIIQNLKKSGNHFIYVGIIFFFLSVVVWIVNLGGRTTQLNVDIVLIPLFLTTIGLFFIIQSNTLNLAKGIKEENELTI